MRRIMGPARRPLFRLRRARADPARFLCSRPDGRMTGEPRLSVEGDAVLRFAPHTRFRFDEVRQAWIVLAPERLMLPDEQAVEILQLIDGKRAVDGVIEELAGRYDAPRDVIAGDVVKMLQDLVDKKVLRL